MALKINFGLLNDVFLTKDANIPVSLLSLTKHLTNFEMDFRGYVRCTLVDDDMAMFHTGILLMDDSAIETYSGKPTCYDIDTCAKNRCRFIVLDKNKCIQCVQYISKIDLRDIFSIIEHKAVSEWTLYKHIFGNLRCDILTDMRIDQDRWLTDKDVIKFKNLRNINLPINNNLTAMSINKLYKLERIAMESNTRVGPAAFFNKAGKLIQRSLTFVNLSSNSKIRPHYFHGTNVTFKGKSSVSFTRASDKKLIKASFVLN